MEEKTIWFHKDLTLDQINNGSANTSVDHLGIEITKIGPNFLEGTMPVDQRTVQPARILHGGVSCVLAETLGSIASNICLDNSKEVAVGQSINASHIRPAFEGQTVIGKCHLIHKGVKSHVWEIKIYDDRNKLVCLSRLTMAVIPKPKTREHRTPTN